MKPAAIATAFLSVVLAAPGFAGSGAAKPRLDARAHPRVAFSPVNVFVTAELKGGDDIEEFHCPGLVWDWGDGSRSARESDCEPYAEGMELQRRFSASHVYRAPGAYTVRVTMRRADRTLAAANVQVLVHGHTAGIDSSY
jgi:hypothetical protein